MRPARILVLLVAATGCYAQASDRAVPATVVNDACGTNVSEGTCAASAGCEWRAVKSACPAGATCPEGVCVTPDPCAGLSDKARCEADTRCAWSGVRLASASIDLCPLGQTCDAGGYCHTRDASGGGCTCVQPIACPTNADCPAVECDCSNPPPGGGGGGGTCTCTCTACAPGETCPPCTCDCDGGGGGGSCEDATGGGTGGGTCTCACPTCAPGTSCLPCDCACGAGNVGVSSTRTTMVGPAETTTPADPCAAHGDTTTCVADNANSCSWIELGIVCITTPCPSGACVQVKAVPGGGGGCGCACPACTPGAGCPPCACDCCGSTKDPGPVPEPVPPAGTP
jgi:hypothetical protein